MAAITNGTGMHSLVGITVSIAVKKCTSRSHFDRNVEFVIPGTEISI